jgi:ferredoxin
MGEAFDEYRALQQHFEKTMPVGLPKSPTGAEIRILKHLFTPEEAKIAVNLGPLPESLDDIYPRVKDTGMSREELEKILDELVMKAVIAGSAGEKGEKRYNLMGWAIGIWEFQIDRISKELAADAKEYEATYYKEWFRPDTPAQMRTIPVGKSFTVEHRVGTYDNIKELIDNAPGPLAVHNCICRQQMDLIGEPCKLSEEQRQCITLGKFSVGLMEAGLADEVTKEELFELLKKWENIGFVLQPENAQSPEYICVCCGDCCGVLSMMKRFPRPAELYTSNYFAVVDPEKCINCEACLDRCQMEARSIVDNKATVNFDRCIGCGLCVTHCQGNASQLQKKEKEIVPPKDEDALYQEIYMKKMGLA